MGGRKNICKSYLIEELVFIGRTHNLKIKIVLLFNLGMKRIIGREITFQISEKMHFSILRCLFQVCNLMSQNANKNKSANVTK